MIKLFATAHIGSTPSGATHYELTDTEGKLVDVSRQAKRAAYETGKASEAVRHAVKAAMGEEVLVVSPMCQMQA